MKIKKMFQGTLPANKIMNTKNTSKTDTYSCDYINNLSNESGSGDLRKTIYTGTLRGGETVTLTETKRFVDVYFRMNFANGDGVGKYTIDTHQNPTMYSSGLIMAFDGSTGQEYYVSESLFDRNAKTLTHTRIGYFSLINNQFTSRNENDSYYIYQIDTYDKNISAQTSAINYSSEEQVIGTWFGKPLYSKTISTNVSFTGSADVPHGVSNYEKIWIDHSKSYYNAGKTNLPLVHNSYWGDFSQKTDALVYNDKVILYSDGGWGTDWEKVITINYTKTTD